MYRELCQAVCRANLLLGAYELVIFAWGNVSAVDRKAGVVAIKASGVPYDDLSPDKMVVLDLKGEVVEGNLRPSSDTPTHLELYRHFKDIGAICHTHSPKATIWAQACCEIPCLGTTHADNFYGPVPVTRAMSEEEIQGDYELNTGKVIVERFKGIDPMQTPAVLVANHGPFVWAADTDKVVETAVVLEQVADMALGTVALNPEVKPMPQVLLDKHYLRKHGKDAYYGQK